MLEERPPLARGKVRHDGKPVAMIVATGEREAMRGALAMAIDQGIGKVLMRQLRK